MHPRRYVRLLVAGALAPNFLLAQLSGPESVEYDAAHDRYYVSNTTSHTILIVDNLLNTMPFVSGLTSGPHGLEMKGDTLFACSGGSIKGYLTNGGVPVFDLDLGAVFLNGLTTDGTYLYTTDFSTNRIYKVDPATVSFSTLVSSTGYTPNGIVYDPMEDRLVVVSWGANATIHEVDPMLGTNTLLYTTPLSNIDGITIDCQGNFIVSSWSPDQLTKYDPLFSAAGVDLGAVGLNNPADIGYDPVHHLVLVPNAGSNTVSFVQLTYCGVGVDEVAATGDFQVFPNPSAGTLDLELPGMDRALYEVQDVTGRIVRLGEWQAGVPIDLRGTPTGMYILVVPQARVRQVVMLQ
ncbi:MAG: T9SS type A sorting domain-containing protein [Flavobacteriales bacterium]|nr:T9SS type A sorting domain-containing protein [Flavobacteriales bacterium]